MQHSDLVGPLTNYEENVALSTRHQILDLGDAAADCAPDDVTLVVFVSLKRKVLRQADDGFSRKQFYSISVIMVMRELSPARLEWYIEFSFLTK
jgi:hypothetical protein